MTLPQHEASRAPLVPPADDDPEQLYERAPCGYLSATPHGVITRVNRTFEELTGYDREQLIGRQRLIDLLSPGGKIYYETQLAPIVALEGHVDAVALEIVTAGGTRTPVLLNAVVQRDSSDIVTRIDAAVFDATGRRAYEQELLLATRRAEASEARARSLAQTLQQTLIPPALPVVHGLDLAAVYRPAGDGEMVGGDFYDVFEVDDGDWIIAIGDVCGKGVDAAVVTALARHTIRAAAIRLPTPHQVLAALNEVMMRHGSDRFCTVAVLRLRYADGEWNATICLGGHPHAVLTRMDSETSRFGQPGTIIGAFENVDLADDTMVMRPGDSLVLYTDGVTEARRDDVLYGQAGLRQSMSRHRGTARVLSNGILNDVLTYQADDARDDIAVVVVQIPVDVGVGQPATGRS